MSGFLGVCTLTFDVGKDTKGYKKKETAEQLPFRYLRIITVSRRQSFYNLYLKYN